MKRLFIAFDLLPQTKAQIASWRIEQNRLHEKQKNIKEVKAKNFHITIAFLGQLTHAQEKEVIALCQSALYHPAVCQYLNENPNKPASGPAAYELLSESLGHFKRPQVTYLAVKQLPAALRSIVMKLKKALQPFSADSDENHYTPHVTILRKSKAIPLWNSPNISMPIKSISLYHSISTSSGVHYQPIKTWPLAQS